MIYLIKKQHHVTKTATIACPIKNCEYNTPDVDPVLAAALITERKLSMAQLTLVQCQLELKSETI